MSWPCRRSRSSTPPRPTSRSAGTQRVCASAWRDFNGFCGEHGLDPLPASPLTVVRYLSHLAKLGRSVSTIDLRTAAIALAHRMAGHDAPTVRDEVRQFLAGIRNTHGRAKLPPKVVDPELLTPEHRIWRAAVFANAGGRCQWLEGCEKSAPRYRMFADHIVERKDGGAPYDPANGQCMCGQHHPLKTARERARRQAERS